MAKCDWTCPHHEGARCLLGPAHKASHECERGHAWPPVGAVEYKEPQPGKKTAPSRAAAAQRGLAIKSGMQGAAPAAPEPTADEWAGLAAAAFRATAVTRRTFTTREIWERLPDCPGDRRGPMRAAKNAAVRDGVIREVVEEDGLPVSIDFRSTGGIHTLDGALVESNKRLPNLFSLIYQEPA